MIIQPACARGERRALFTILDVLRQSEIANCKMDMYVARAKPSTILHYIIVRVISPICDAGGLWTIREMYIIK